MCLFLADAASQRRTLPPSVMDEASASVTHDVSPLRQLIINQITTRICDTRQPLTSLQVSNIVIPDNR